MRLPTLLLLAALACASANDPHPSHAGAPAAADTTLAITGPAFISLFPAVTQAQVDADDELATVLDDFSHHRAEAARVLREAGVAVHDVWGSRARLVAGDPPRVVAVVSADAPRFVLVAPGRPPRVLEGVQTDIDLLHAAAVYLRIPALQPYLQ